MRDLFVLLGFAVVAWVGLCAVILIIMDWMHDERL